MNYTYESWEHMSFLNTHIRFIHQRREHLILPIQQKHSRYQDSGIYVCSVSNGVPNVHGEYFQKGYSFVVSKGMFKTEYLFLFLWAKSVNSAKLLSFKQSKL